MIDFGKQNVIGINIDAVDYDAAVARVIDCAKNGRRCATSALAVHGLITGATDPAHRFRLNHMDLVVPDGQPVRWALNALYALGLSDRVYGPTLTLLLCKAAARENVPVFFYGSTDSVIQKLCEQLRKLCPGLPIAGAKASEYRSLTGAERASVVERIQESEARLLFVGLGCPRQEVFAYEMSEHLSMPIVAVGAAFDYHAGLLHQPPRFVQRAGLQWLYRLIQEPGRLWKRYLVTNTQFIVLFALQLTRLWRPDPRNSQPPKAELRFG